MSKEMTPEELKKIAVLRGISKEAVIKLQKTPIKDFPKAMITKKDSTNGK